MVVTEYYFFDKERFITQKVLCITPGHCIAKMHTAVQAQYKPQKTLQKKG
jgi:hypothetical protein